MIERYAMTDDETKTALLAQIHDAVVGFDEETSARLCRQVLAEGIDPYDAIMNGLAAGMNTSTQQLSTYFLSL